MREITITVTETALYEMTVEVPDDFDANSIDPKAFATDHDYYDSDNLRGITDMHVEITESVAV